MRSNLMRGSSCLSKLGGRFAHQRLSFQANGHPMFQGAPRCKRCERKSRDSASHDEQRSSSNLSDTRHFVAAGWGVTKWFSSCRGSYDWLRSVTIKSATRAIPAVDPNNRLAYMKPIVQTANVEGEIPLKEVIPFWFAVSSSLLGALLRLLGAWFVAWLSV